MERYHFSDRSEHKLGAPLSGVAKNIERLAIFPNRSLQTILYTIRVEPNSVMRSAKNRFIIYVLIAALGLILACRVTAQTLTTLHSFTAAPPPFTNSDGANPGGLLLSGKTLYGTTLQGGSSGNGVVFAMSTDGTGFRVLHDFTAASDDSSGVFTNGDGANPAILALSGNTLYGTAYNGGTSGNGTIFRVNASGTGFMVLYTFSPLPFPDHYGSNYDGAYPNGLVVSGSTLYGTAAFGGASGFGTLFAMSAYGGGFTNMHSFTGYPNDGAGPNGGLILTGNNLYGITSGGGNSGHGTVFIIYGGGYGIVHHLNGGSDGAGPVGLILGSTNLYGIAAGGGGSGIGTVFKLNSDGTDFATLHSFAPPPPPNTNSDGAYPNSLVLSGQRLYGTASQGGSSHNGTVFTVNTDGTGFSMLYNFSPTPGFAYERSPNDDGAEPNGLLLSGSLLYGTAFYGGTSGAGTVFSLSFPPQLAITFSGTNVILTWPTNYAGFDYSGFTLQSTTNLVAPVWMTNSPAPAVVNGENTVTNPISGTQQFFRLSQ